jgi:hypothetical protein
MSTPDLISRRISHLEAFRSAVVRWGASNAEDDDDELRATINRKLVAARQAVREAGVAKSLTIRPPSGTGVVHQDVDPFAVMFAPPYRVSVLQDVIGMVDQALGVYDALRDESGLVRLAGEAETVEIESAIDRALRPSFREPPQKERDVQDAIEVILRAIGVGFTREQETAPVAGRAYKPDFVVAAQDLAIEVKLTGPRLSESDAQEQLGTDIAGYRTRWKRLLAVVYDLGVVRDPERMRTENMKLFGVRVLIVKH